MTDPSQLDLLARAARVFPGGVLGRHLYPEGIAHVPVRGKGSRIWDAEGREYIDYSCGGGSLILGYSHPAILAAVRAQMEQATQFVSIINIPALEMGEAMLRALPWMERVRFCLSGSEAIFLALRLARAFTRRDKILKFEGAYHGNSDYSMWSIDPAGPPAYPRGEPDTAGIPRRLAEEVLIAPYNDLEATRQIVKAAWQDLAAIIVEPVQRYYGPRPGFLEGLRELATAYGAVLIFDEIVTGFRLAYGGAQEAFGVTPDLAVFGKAVGGGFPLSAVGGRTEILELANPRLRAARPADYVYVTSSQAGNPIGCTAGKAVLEELARPGVFATFLGRAEHLKEGLRKIVTARDLDAQLVGVGPLWDVVFTRQPIHDHRSAQAADRKKHVQFHVSLIQKGIMVRAGGRSYFSTAHTETEIEATLRACDQVLRKC